MTAMFDRAPHVMLDLETLGRSSSAAIVAIGAVQFNPFTGDIGGSCYITVNLASSVAAGLQIEPETVIWWLQQSDPARSALASAAGQGRPLIDALRDCAAWLPRGTCVWGNGAAFDNALLSNAYRQAGMEQPWHYHNDRCYRTLRALFPDVPSEPPEVAHRALDDALAQAKHVLKIAATMCGNCATEGLA